MTILAVDYSVEALASLQKLLSVAFPNGLVLAWRDPLAAAKYSYTNPVDVLLATPETRPMNGWKLSEFVRQTNPKAVLLMIVEPGREALDCLCADKVDALLPRPICAEDIRRAVEKAREAGEPTAERRLNMISNPILHEDEGGNEP